LKNKIHYIDIGARNDLTEPWLSHENELNIFCFEADPTELLKLQTLYKNRKFFQSALYHKSGKINLNITINPSQSSIYKINDISEFEKQHWINRQIKDTIEVPCSTLDKTLMENFVDAIKIDTQGAEYDILKGGENILTSKYPILFLETWCFPVYRNAP